LLGAELGFGIDVAELQPLHVGRNRFKVDLYLAQILFFSLALCRILRAFDFFLH
jgi:hypothetical protein